MDYNYNPDGTFNNYEFSFTLWDANGNELVIPISLKVGNYIRKTCNSDEYLTLTPNQISQ